MADRKMALMKGEIREPLSPISANKATARTPHKRTASRNATARTPGNKTPNIKKSGAGTEGSMYDRFIPNRSLMNVQQSHHLLLKPEKDENESSGEEEYSERMKQNLNGDADQLGSRILQMKIKAPQNKEGEVAMKMLYTKSRPTPLKFKSTRHIPSVPDKILDAPEIVDDYYLNLLHWGNNGLIAVPLYNAIYLWNSESGAVDELFGDNPITDDNLVITSVRWIGDGAILAVGLSNGVIELWDAESCKRVRAMTGHASRVGCLDWNEHLLTSAARSGAIFNHDVRVAEHHVSSFLHHSQEVCGLEWAPNGKLLASGGNDNILNIWDIASTETSSTQRPYEVITPMHSLCEHMAAVKAVAWCPWQRNILASGGGTLDRHVRIWNAGTGACLQSHDTMSQVSGILWSGTYKEILCSHGSQMTIWKYPSMVRETELTGHTGRILNVTMSPNGHLVASAGADETLRLWRCFEPDQKKTRPTKKAADRPNISSMHSIR